MDGILNFRNLMAESGTEYTPKQAKESLAAVEDFRQYIFDDCRENPEKYANLDSISDEDKELLCAESGLSSKEFDDCISVIAMFYEQEKMF